MSMQRQIDRLVALRAAEWYELLKEATDERKAGFSRWIGESPRHMEAFLSIAGQAAVVRKILADKAVDYEQLLQGAAAPSRVLPLPAEESANNPAITSTQPYRRWLWRSQLGTAAATFAIALLGALLYHFVLSWTRFETPIGEQRTIQLAEGSVVNMNAHSRMDVRFSESLRAVRLPDGEATFKVAKDPRRPFRVTTPDAIIEAVGTQFNVYVRRNGTTEVTVLEGKVKVLRERSREARTGTVMLAAGAQAQVQSSGNISYEERVDVAQSIAWQRRKLIFKRTSLEDMAKEFNRYNRAIQIRLEGIEPGSFRYSGAFNADDPRSLALLLQRESDLSVEQRGSEIVISRSDAF